jgi:HEPN domain-containing protein
LKVNAVPLALPELAEIEGLSYTKAGTILDEARSRLKAFDYDLTVRRSQEAFELYLKSLFRFLQTEYPANHDLRKQIYELTEALKQYQIDRRQIARLVLANSILDLWRSPAFYGDERLNVGGLFNDVEAALAISYAELAQFICAVVRGFVYQRAASL